jgi:hypothetical protein
MIRGKRIRSFERHFGHVPRGTRMLIGVDGLDNRGDELRRIGFRVPAESGEAVLPRPIGPVSRFNAEGAHRIHRDQPKETLYRLIQWSWTEHHGPHEVEQSDIREVPYKRFPRTPVEPPSVELQVVTTIGGRTLLVAPPIDHTGANEERILHIVNLFLEIFGECSIFDEAANGLISVPVRRMRWNVLPPGEWPWERLQMELAPVIRSAPAGNQVVISYRFEIVNSLKPDFVAVGHAGFHGYVIFAFPDRGLYVLESIYFGNATYVLGDDWQTISQRTKAEILREDLHVARIIHRRSWHMRIRNMLSSAVAS